MKYILISFLLLGKLAAAQTYGWSASAGGNLWDDLKSSHIGNDNCTVVAGMISGTAGFGSVVLSSLAYQDAFVAKYDQQGNVLWAKAIQGANEQDWAYKVTTDAANNVLVTGFFQSSSLRFTASDSIVKNSASFRNAFVAKYDSNGVFKWAKLISGGTTSSFITATGLATDNNGNVIVTGQYTKGIDCSGTAGPNVVANGANIFMTKYASNGAVLWVKAGESTAQCGFADVCCDAANNIYATGKISKKIKFGTTVSAQVSGDQLAIAKFDAAGVCQWISLYGDSLSASTSGNNFDCGSSIKLDQLGNIFIGGSLLDTFYLDVNTNALVIKQYAIVAKYSNGGAQLWLKQFGDDEKDVINAIDVDAAGDVYAAGNYRNSISIGGVFLPLDTNTSGFVAKFNGSTGNTDFAYKNGINSKQSEAIGIGVHSVTGMVYTTGIYDSTLAFNNTLNTAGTWDIYVSALNNGVFPAAIGHNNAINSFVVYPNPASNNLRFKGSTSFASDKTLVSIYTSQGALLLQQYLSAGPTVNIAALPVGTYIISLSDGNTRAAQYFTKY